MFLQFGNAVVLVQHRHRRTHFIHHEAIIVKLHLVPAHYAHCEDGRATVGMNDAIGQQSFLQEIIVDALVAAGNFCWVARLHDGRRHQREIFPDARGVAKVALEHETVFSACCSTNFCPNWQPSSGVQPGI